MDLTNEYFEPSSFFKVIKSKVDELVTRHLELKLSTNAAAASALHTGRTTLITESDQIEEECP